MHNVAVGGSLNRLVLPLCVSACTVLSLPRALAEDNPSAESEKAKPAASNLTIGTQPFNKVLFLGNSITLHGPAPKIGWTGNWGMAASAQEKDYVHLLLAQITKAAGGAPQVKVKNIADFERQLTKYSLSENLNEELDWEADVVIIAIGENAAPLKTEEDKERFRTAFTDLLTQLKQHRNPAIFVRSQFWPSADKDDIMKQVSSELGATFIDACKLGAEPANYAREERKIEHAGVGAHPGDKGMQALADALWAAIGTQAGVKQAD
jgi:lysophospholipase L1-like esterase